MRIVLLFILLAGFTQSKSQAYVPATFRDYVLRNNFAHSIPLTDSASNKKWSFNKYVSLSTTFSFFKGGNATIFAAPIGLQVNRKLNENLYAFAGISAAPAYVNFNRSFMQANVSKLNGSNGFSRAGNFTMYSRAEVGLMYVNDAKTFSISGSLSVERSTYPMYNYYPALPSTTNRASSFHP